MWATVQVNTIFVQYAINGATAGKPTDSKNVVKTVPLVVHIYNILFPFHFGSILTASISRHDVLLQQDSR